MSFSAANNDQSVYFSGRSYHAFGAAQDSTPAGKGSVAAFDHGDAPSFSDLIDIINPLQHIPVISTIYRQLTGDHESAFASVVGGLLYGGPIGMAGSMLDLGVHDATGKSAGDAVAALVTGSDAKDTMVGSAAPAAGPKTVASTNIATGATVPANPAAAPTPVAAAAPKQATAAAAPMSKPNPFASAAQAKPIALTPSSSSAQTAAASTASGGPVAQGNYLVFGSGDGQGPGPAPVSSPSPYALAPAPAAANAAAPAAPQPLAVNGQNAAPAKTLPPVAEVSMPASRPAVTVQASAQPQPRVFPAPQRNMNATPTAVLPPPTTGPGALPGGKSQAMTAEQMATAQDPAHNFLAAYLQAVEKYRTAQGLGPVTAQPAVAAAPGGPTPAQAVSDAMGLPPAQAPSAPATDEANE